jgi:NADH-quinone oxidoreductase subunit H
MLNWIESNIPAWVFITLIIPAVVLGMVAYMILLERKTASWFQDRIGPNRVGFSFGLPFMPQFHFWGLGQPLADGMKFIFKEDYRPKGVDKILFTIAPASMMIAVMVSVAVVPWGGVKSSTMTVDVRGQADPIATARDAVLIGATLDGDPVLSADKSTAVITYHYPFQIADVNIGILFVLATLSLAVYGVVIGGWASNNKYSFLGGLRATANMISYEIPLGLAVLCIVLTFGTLNLGDLVARQCHNWIGIIPAWNVFSQPLTFVMFLICIHAEANRAPFDLAECEQELVGGYHTEYSSMRFALFFLAEYAGMITTSAVCVALFFGGWDLPGLRGPDAAHPEITASLIVCVLRTIVFLVKTLVIIFVFMWVRWSLPRFRFDQLMMLAWRGLIPVSLALLVMTALAIYIVGGGRDKDLSVGPGLALLLLAGNVIVGALSLIVSRLIPAAPDTNRRVTVANSRFNKPKVADASTVAVPVVVPTH